MTPFSEKEKAMNHSSRTMQMSRIFKRRSGRLLAAVALGSALALVLGACSSDADSPSEAETPAPQEDVSTEQAGASVNLVKQGQFTACVDPTVRPMEFYDEANPDRPIGFDIALIDATADAWGVKGVIAEKEFPGLLPALAGGECDVVWSAIFMEPDRLEGDFDAVPYLNGGPMIMVAEGNPKNITAPEDLSGLTISTQTGTNFPGILEELNAELKSSGKDPVTVQEYPGGDEAAQQLIVGRADAWMGLDLDGYAREADDSLSMEIAYEYPKEVPYGVFYLKTKEDLGSELQATIDGFYEDGTIKELIDTWQLSPLGMLGS